MFILLYRIIMDKILSNISEQEIQKVHSAIGQRVKHFREEKSLSQLDLALTIGIKSVAFYSNCENSKNNKHFNIEHIYKICNALDITLSDFFDRLENKL